MSGRISRPTPALDGAHSAIPTPLRPKKEGSTANSAAGAAPDGTESQAPGNGSAKRILVVDDNAVILKTLSMKLSAGGYDVVTVADSAGVISVVRREKPDLVLLDIDFPADVAHSRAVAWDGLTIMKWLRGLNEAKGLPVIIITGSPPWRYKQRALAAGAAAFFQKPIDNQQLLETIDGILKKATGSA